MVIVGTYSTIHNEYYLLLLIYIRVKSTHVMLSVLTCLNNVRDNNIVYHKKNFFSKVDLSKFLDVGTYTYLLEIRDILFIYDSVRYL